MNHVKELNDDAWKDMLDVSVACWSKSHFKPYIQFDLQVNNTCEAFNIVIF